LIRRASSTALTSVAFNAPSPDRSSRFVPASRRRTDVASGTCFTHTAIFTSWPTPVWSIEAKGFFFMISDSW